MRWAFDPARWGRPGVLVVALLLVAVVGLVDYATGPGVAFAIFYVTPVAAASWFAGAGLGLIVGAASFVAWGMAHLVFAHEPSSLSTVLWNVALQVWFYVLATESISALREARQVREELTHFIVHDLRSPLVTLEMAVDELRELGADASPEERNRLLDIASASSRRMLPLINSILDLSRLERARMPVRPTQVEVAELVEGAIDQVALWARNCNVDIVRDVAPEPRAIRIDGELTGRVLVNLLSNALRCSPAGATITVGFRPDGTERVTFTVADEGPGVPEEWLGRVFEPYTQVEARRAGVSLGTGLGLTFCRLAAKAQGGSVRMENRPQRGAMVTLTLPVSVAAHGARK